MEQTQAASSTVEVVDPFNGETPSLAEFQQYRKDGTLPERVKPKEDPAASAAPAPADPPKEDDPEGESPEDDPDSEPEEAQEHPQKGSAAEKRIKQLLAKTKELERKLADRAKPTQTDSSPAPRQPQNYKEYRAAFKPSDWVAEYAKANPNASYEDGIAAMNDHLDTVREHFRGIETRVSAEKAALDAKVTEARERYENFDEIKDSFLAKVISDKGTPLIPLPVLGIINDSDVMADLLYTLAENETEFDKFVAMAKADPNKAIRYVTRVENLIAEELAKPKDSKETPARGEDGKFTKAPEPKKTTAPKPVSPVGNGTVRGNFDVSDESLSADEWWRQRQAQVDKRKG